MSWQDFYTLINQQNTDITAWMAAIDANPNTPEDALKVAVLQMIQREDGEMLEKLAQVVIDLVRNADGMLDTLIELKNDLALDFEPGPAYEPVVVVGLDDPREEYDFFGSFNLPDIEDNGPIVSVW